MRIQVDLREPNILKDAFENSELLNLDLGDFIIRNDNDTIMAIFERKTIDDLLASVKDSRYADQSERLSNLDIDKNHIYYIIEGNKYNYIGIQNKILYSCIYSLSYKKGFSVIFTNNTIDTVKFIKEIYNRIENNKDTIKRNISLIKKEIVSKENIYSLMLSNVPGIGLNTSKEILTNFDGQLINLIKTLRENNDCLDTLKINNRKLSKKIIENIKIYLL